MNESWRCKCGCRHGLSDDACPLCRQRRVEVFAEEVSRVVARHPTCEWCGCEAWWPNGKGGTVCDCGRTEVHK